MRRRDWELIFGPRVVEPGRIASMAVEPACVFHGLRFSNHGDVEVLVIHQITIDGKHQKLPSRRQLLSSFDHKFDVSNGDKVIVSIKNRGTERRNVHVRILGKASFE